MSNLLKDKEGNTSSKRVAAFVTIATAILVAGYAVIQDPGQAGNILWPLCIMGAALLGVTVLEKKK